MQKKEELNNSLLKAADEGKLSQVRELLSQGADKNIKDDIGCTPLHYAASNGHIEVVEELLAKGADIEARDQNDWIPLHYASVGGNIKVIKKLLSAGSDLEAKNSEGNTPLDSLFYYQSNINKLKTALDESGNSNIQSKFQLYRILNHIEKKILEAPDTRMTLEEVKNYKEKLGHDCYKKLAEETMKSLDRFAPNEGSIIHVSEPKATQIQKALKQLQINYKQIIDEKFIKNDEELEELNNNFKNAIKESTLVTKFINEKKISENDLFLNIKSGKQTKNNELGNFNFLGISLLIILILIISRKFLLKLTQLIKNFQRK